MSRTGISQRISRIIILAGLLLALLTVAGTTSLRAQSFDHESYPKLDFDFVSLNLQLGLQPQNLRIDGLAEYQIKANVSGADTVILYASHMDISSVSVDEKKADFTLHNDSLLVPLGQAAEAGQEFTVSVRYSGSPKFGILKNSNGTVWTSLLPKAQRHWVPIVDNPHVTFKTNFDISVPSGYQVWATGQKTGEETVSVDVMKYQFSSQKQVPASALALTVGNFKSQAAAFGEKQINLVAERALVDTVNSRQLLQYAQDYLRQAENRFESEYPYEQLNIVLTDDHSWETKSWAASTIFIYKNGGNLQQQLLRGIIGQWFGIRQRETQWQQADAINLYQTVVQQSLTDSSTVLKQQDSPPMLATIYNRFSEKRWNQWQQEWKSWDESKKKVIKDAEIGILANLPPVISWQDYAGYWYRQSGQPMFKLPQMAPAGDSASSEPVSDSVAYKVDYALNENQGQLKLSFEATHGHYKELTSIRAYEIYPNKTDTSEVTFTGAQDSVVLQVDPMISNLQLVAPDRPHLYLDEYKPASFLLNELRNSSSVEQKAAAARKLGVHTENPDLQLAIKDLLNREQAPKVRAALLSSLADITNGASGTEQTFLDALKSNHRAIRDAALMGLQNYKNNSQVIQRVQRLAENADNFELFRKATQVLTAAASQQDFQSFAEGVTQRDSVGHRSIFVIQELANRGDVDEAIEKASLFTESDYSYEVRSRALQILIQHDHAPTDWLSRAKNLLQTSDPRIRLLVVRGLERNRNGEITDFLAGYIQDEYDARVHQKIEQVLDNE